MNREKSRAFLNVAGSGGLADETAPPARLRMVGAMIGDVAGSGYEWHNIKHKPERLIRNEDKFTDDTILTYAVAFGIIEGMEKIDRSVWMNDAAMQAAVEKNIAMSLKQFGLMYPYAGYGHAFREWLSRETLEPYDSWGNGSAMRASFAGWYANSPEEAELLGKVSARFTHGHENGVKGAVTVAGCIYLLRTGQGKDEVRRYTSQYYDKLADPDFTLDNVRPEYSFDVSCEGSVPHAVEACLESGSFEETLKAAISIGGDSDTIAAIAGSLAEAIYPVPADLLSRAWDKLDNRMKLAVRTVDEVLRRNDQPNPPNGR
jgi:type I restriction enzyme M protein